MNPCLSSCSHILTETCKCDLRATGLRWIGHDKISPRLCHTSDGHDTSIWVQPSLKQNWQSWTNELDETKDLSTVCLATYEHPGTIWLGNLTGGQDDSYQLLIYSRLCLGACISNYNLSGLESQGGDEDHNKTRATFRSVGRKTHAMQHCTHIVSQFICIFVQLPMYTH